MEFGIAIIIAKNSSHYGAASFYFNYISKTSTNWFNGIE